MNKKILAISALLVVALINNIAFAGSTKKNGSIKRENAATIQAQVLGQTDEHTVILLEFTQALESNAVVTIKDTQGATLYTFTQNTKAFSKRIKVDLENLENFVVTVTTNGVSISKDFEIKLKTETYYTIEK